MARVIAAWAERYLDMAVDVQNADGHAEPGTVMVRETRRGKFQQEVMVGAHRCWPMSR